MSENTISPLRQRMIEDMSVRNFVEKTRNDYIRHVRTFTSKLLSVPSTQRTRYRGSALRAGPEPVAPTE